MSISIFTIFFLNLTNILVSSTFLNAESNYLKPKLERNNIVNKGVWVRDPKDINFEKSNRGEFIFRANSLDVDSLLQNNFDAFGNNAMQEGPGIINYVERSKRAVDNERKLLLRETMKECKNDKECIRQNMADKSIYVKSKLISKLKPTSVFNDYPYEVAILLGENNKDENIRVKDSTDDNNVIPLNNKKETFNGNGDSIDKSVKVDTTVESKGTPKRSMKNDFEREVIKKIEITEELGSDNATTKVDRHIFDKEDRIWHQNMPISDTNTYKIMPKYPLMNKPVNERGLIKVLSMLTKTFKKIMRQHSDIKKIHNKLHVINDEVNRNIVDMNKKIKEVEDKNSYIINVHDKIKIIESNMNLKEEFFKKKETEMSKNLIEFENQQKKFLTQQRQFYNIQKLMLAQNEKINMKQNLIAKTQSEISHRQNNFARILKKAKQIYIDNKHLTSKLSSSTTKPNINETDEANKIAHTTTQAPQSTESIKINLFSIPALNRLVNQDTLILKEKDEHPVDDLVYKYYFNNTFIDNLMKSKVLSTFMTTADNTEVARNTKNKREKDELETTILLPLNKHESSGSLNRERRWIHHISKAKLKRKHRSKSNIVNVNNINDEKPLRPKIDSETSKIANKATILFAQDKSSPFRIMAKNFCTEIGQNSNDQMLNWCIEKALRRLQYMQYMDMSGPDPTVPMPRDSPKEITNSPITPTSITTEKVPTSTVTPSPKTSALVSKMEFTTSIPTTQDNLIYFPDNEELEYNLKQYDLTPDTEGNVYYDRSLHSSDLVPGPQGPIDSDGFSDIMPGLDSNSRVDVDPMTFDLQAQRRATVRRINANIMKNIVYG